MTAVSRASLRGAVVLLLTALSASCALTVREQRQVNAWLGCSECTEGQLDSLADIGRRALKRRALVAMLRPFALPAPDTSAFLAPLSAEYRADSAFTVRLSGVPLAGWPTQAQWASRHARGSVVSLQVRALIALGTVRTSSALAVLDSACVTARDRSVACAAVRARLAVDSASAPCRARAGLPALPRHVSP